MTNDLDEGFTKIGRRCKRASLGSRVGSYLDVPSRHVHALDGMPQVMRAVHGHEVDGATGESSQGEGARENGQETEFGIRIELSFRENANIKTYLWC
jgi:hypothetical protein